MFTGIVAGGRAHRRRASRATALRGSSSTPASSTLDDVAIGDSDRRERLLPDRRRDRTRPPLLAFDVSAETLACTTGLDVVGRRQPGEGAAPGRPARRPPDDRACRRRGIVVAAVDRSPRDAGSCRARRRRARASSRASSRAKGSIALAGVSLTVNDVAGDRFDVNLIPHTLDATTLGHLRSGSRVNLEIDLVARYVARWLGSVATSDERNRTMDLTTLERAAAVDRRQGGRREDQALRRGHQSGHRRSDPPCAARQRRRCRRGRRRRRPQAFPAWRAAPAAAPCAHPDALPRADGREQEGPARSSSRRSTARRSPTRKARSRAASR